MKGNQRFVVARKMRVQAANGMPNNNYGLVRHSSPVPVSYELRRRKITSKDSQWVVRNIVSLIDADGDVVVTPTEINRYFFISPKDVTSFVASNDCMAYGKNNSVGAKRENVLRYLCERRPNLTEAAAGRSLLGTFLDLLPHMKYDD